MANGYNIAKKLDDAYPKVVGITYLAKLLHPEVDLDPVSVHKEYLQLLGLEYPEGRTYGYTVFFWQS